jgi:hypothetical protein
MKQAMCRERVAEGDRERVAERKWQRVPEREWQNSAAEGTVRSCISMHQAQCLNPADLQQSNDGYVVTLYCAADLQLPSLLGR